MNTSFLKRLPVFFIFISTFVNGQWNKIPFPSIENLWKVRFANENTGWIAGHKFMYKTTNGGQTWTAHDSTKGSVFAMSVLNDQTLLYSVYTLGIRRTTDGGTTWQLVDTNKHYYDDMEFVNSNVGYISGGAAPTNKIPIVRKTTDGGSTWMTVSQNFSKTKYELTGISFTDVNTGWTVSYDGFVYQTINGGIDWALQDSVGFYSFRDIDFFNVNYGWIVGGISGYQELAYTTNGGTIWKRISQNGSSTREVEIVDSINVWFAGSNNGPPFIAHYDTIGRPWKTQDINDKFIGVESIDMVNTKTGYAVGGQGLVYKTTNGGVLSAKPEKLSSNPAAFALEQNFPNPFNPSTVINFSIPEKQFVSLKIFSVAGMLIDNIVQQTMDAGTYSIRWNAQQFPNGVYFCTLSSGTKHETKKLMLLK